MVSRCVHGHELGQGHNAWPRPERELRLHTPASVYSLWIVTSPEHTRTRTHTQSLQIHLSDHRHRAWCIQCEPDLPTHPLEGILCSNPSGPEPLVSEKASLFRGSRVVGCRRRERLGFLPTPEGPHAVNGDLAQPAFRTWSSPAWDFQHDVRKSQNVHISNFSCVYVYGLRNIVLGCFSPMFHSHKTYT